MIFTLLTFLIALQPGLKGSSPLVFTFFADEPYRGPFNSRGASNIPLVIVMIIIATAFIVVMVIFGKKFFVVFCKNNELRRQSTPSSTQSNELPPSSRRRPAVAASVVLPAEPNEHTPALAATSSDDAPSAPPSYEEVIKDNPGILSRGVPLAPPSYSESQSMTTTQVWKQWTDRQINRSFMAFIRFLYEIKRFFLMNIFIAFVNLFFIPKRFR